MTKPTVLPPLALALVLSLAGVLIACGGAAPPEPTTPEPSAAAEPSAAEEEDDWGFDEPEVSTGKTHKKSAIETLGITGPDKPWEKMSDEEREWYMVGKVHPVMREVFTNFNDRYSEFTCETCHGPDGKERGWEMPSTHLSALPPADSQEFEEMQGSKLVTFMREEVTKHTATLLGVEPFDPNTGEGFSCYDCHPKE